MTAPKQRCRAVVQERGKRALYSHDCKAAPNTTRLEQPLCAMHAKVYDKAEARRTGHGWYWAHSQWGWEKDIFTGEILP